MVKNWNFPKGLFYDFCRKLEILKLFLFRKTRERKFLAMFQLVKKAILDDKNLDLLMVKKLKFSKGVSPWFLSKIENFEIVPFWTY